MLLPSAFSWNFCPAWRDCAIAPKCLRTRLKRPRHATAAADEPLLPIGEEFDFKIIKMNEAQKRIGLEHARHRRRRRAEAGWASTSARLLPLLPPSAMS